MSRLSFYESEFLSAIYTRALAEKQSEDLHLSDAGRGKIVLGTNNDVNRYISAYLPQHIEKLFRLFDQFDFSPLYGKSIKLVDWACGPGTATLAFLEYCRMKNIKLDITRIVVIDAGKAAIEKAALFLEEYYNKYAIGNPISKPEFYIRNKMLSEIISTRNTKHDVVVHFLSNVLDMIEEDMEELASKIAFHSWKTQYLLCAGPTYPRHAIGLNEFASLLSQKLSLVANIHVNMKFPVKSYIYRSNVFQYKQVTLNGRILQVEGW